MRLQVVEQVDTERFGILERIRKASQRYEAARVELDKARHDRDELVVIGRDLHQLSYAELARAIGQTTGRVHGILTDREAFRPAAGADEPQR
jgi:DNA-directed RNA polymerase specialized sigma24 family protein